MWKLSSLDEYLGRYYAVALEAAGAGAACLKSDQRSWVKTIRNPCGADAACLSTAYLQRLAALDGFQPGASALKNIALPEAPVMVAALPPEADTVAGKARTPMEMRGQLVWEHDDINNMGFAVKPAKGRLRAFVHDMSINADGPHDIIRTLIERESAAQFLVRGMATDDGGFDDGQCRMVYRLPRRPEAHCARTSAWGGLGLAAKHLHSLPLLFPPIHMPSNSQGEKSHGVGRHC